MNSPQLTPALKAALIPFGFNNEAVDFMSVEQFYASALKGCTEFFQLVKT